MEFCDDCKWCSVNFTPSKKESERYICPELEKKECREFTCMHPSASKGARFDCKYCSEMRDDASFTCGREAIFFEAFDKES